MKRLKFILPHIALMVLFGGCSSEANITGYGLKVNGIGFLYGIIIIVLVFYLCVSLLGLKLKYPLFFSALLFMFLLYSDSLNYNYFMRLLHISGAGISRAILFSSKAWLLFFLTAYLHEFFKSVYSGTILKIILALTLLQQIYAILSINSQSLHAYYILNIVYSLELLSNVFIVLRGAIRNRSDALFNFLGIIIIAAAYYYNETQVIPYYDYLMFAAIFLFLILQMLSMAKRIIKLCEEKKNAELRFLHAQIKPHYIFNALNTIISISRYNSESARQLLCDFSIYLQKSFDLKSENQFTSLKDELELVNVYLNIEKARFEERIEIEMLLPEKKDHIVPVCILQPIIENAIVHGILNKPEGGRIFLSIVHKEDKLEFTVRDTGVGMSEEKITDVLESDNIGHIGLSNINKRLKAFYRKGLTIKSKPGEGTEVFWEVILNN